MYVCMYACMCICMCVCMHVCMYACMHQIKSSNQTIGLTCKLSSVRMTLMHRKNRLAAECMYVCMWVGMYVDMYVCMHVYMCACFLYLCLCLADGPSCGSSSASLGLATASETGTVSLRNQLEQGAGPDDYRSGTVACILCMEPIDSRDQLQHHLIEVIAI